MISITGDDTEIACWGEVFGLETRDIKTKRGTDMTIVNFSFSDHTNSLNASLFIDTHRMGDIAPLKDGAFILVNGSYEFDNYKKDFVVSRAPWRFCRNTPKRMNTRAKSALNCTATPICPQRTRFPLPTLL